MNFRDFDDDRREQAPRYYLGLDLGQAQDYTALVAVERNGDLQNAVCSVPAITRYKLGTGYPEIVASVAEKLARAPGQTKLALDGTGVGRAVVDLFLQHPGLSARSSDIIPVTITAGDSESREDGYYRVPKRNLVGVVQVLLQSQRLKIAENLPETPTLVSELQTFKVKITSAANDVYGEWREGKHDDLVLAVALACWASTHPGVNAEFRQGKFRR
jgi:hypothetical protein